ncbi:MAG: hypothetical protein C0404_08660 [Verrucomicrobia bacterium]|nr:hypothetical protein [Verrucomicrobiota bacterium]
MTLRQWLLIALGALIGGAGLFVIFKIWAHKQALKKQVEKVQSKIRPVREELKAGKAPAKDAIEALASNPQTRSALFECLREMKKLELFPEKYNNQKALAESDLVYWLSGPGQLGVYPDNIEFVKEMEIDSETPAGKIIYYLFRFRMKSQHWSTATGWMAGFSGPYVAGQPPKANVPGVYSSMLGYDKQSPDKHLLSAHHILKQKGVYQGLPAGKSNGKAAAKPSDNKPGIAPLPAAVQPSIAKPVTAMPSPASPAAVPVVGTSAAPKPAAASPVATAPVVAPVVAPVAPKPVAAYPVAAAPVVSPIAVQPAATPVAAPPAVVPAAVPPPAATPAAPVNKS